MANSPIFWSGAKRKLAPLLAENIPTEFQDYYEPFGGGLSLFFYLSLPSSKKAYLSDILSELTNAWEVIRDNSESLIEQLDEMLENDSKEYYYKVREQHYLTDPIQRAARFIFITKRCFQGMWRENKKGLCTSSFGYRKRKMYDREEILECSSLLKNTVINTCSYQKINPKEKDFVYLDPPYIGAGKMYNKAQFGIKEQEELSDFCRELDRRGVYFMQSNADSPLIDELYKGFTIQRISSPQTFRIKKDQKKKKEVLITNY